MVQPRKLVILVGAAAAALVVVRRGRHGAGGHQVPGGILIGDAVLYDSLSRRPVKGALGVCHGLAVQRPPA
jgi:hypothetical protein